MQDGTERTDGRTRLDPGTLCATIRRLLGQGLLAAGALASWFPARRATGISPTLALRGEQGAEALGPPVDQRNRAGEPTARRPAPRCDPGERPGA